MTTQLTGQPINQPINQDADQDADRALKAKARAVWASGDYPAVAAQVIPTLGRTVVEAAGVRPGTRVLDVAAGSGNAAIPAALAGADVVASDLTPELLDAGRAKAEAQGVSLRWEEGDAEALPYPDATFDTVVSCVGVMFAPHHQQAADELVRTVRPGGALGLASWTPEGFIGRVLTTMRPYAPAPPPGAQPPPLWGSEQHVTALLGDRVADVRAERRSVVVDCFARGSEFVDFFKAAYGPTVAVYRSLADDPERTAELDDALARLADEAMSDGVMEWEYLLFTARRC